MLGINRNALDFNIDTVFGEGEDFHKASLKDYNGKWLILFLRLYFRLTYRTESFG